MKDFDFDELLDDVLRKDVQAEPRIGMERRVLAGVRADSRRGWRVWGVPAAAFAGLVLGGVLMMHHWDGVRDGARDLAIANKVTDAPSPAKTMRGGALPPTGQKVRKVFEKGWLSPDLSSAPPLLSRERVAAVRTEQDGADETERLPKMETFPALAQSGGFLPEPGGDGMKELREAVNSPQVAQALLELKAKQEQPIEVSAIEIKPL